MEYEIDWNRVMEILKERSGSDKKLALQLEVATWQAIAERLKDKFDGPSEATLAPTEET